MKQKEIRTDAMKWNRESIKNILLQGHKKGIRYSLNEKELEPEELATIIFETVLPDKPLEVEASHQGLNLGFRFSHEKFSDEKPYTLAMIIKEPYIYKKTDEECIDVAWYTRLLLDMCKDYFMYRFYTSGF